MHEEEEESSPAPADWGEGAGDAEDDHLLAGGEGMEGQLLHLAVLVEPRQRPLRKRITHRDRCHSSPFSLLRSASPPLIGE